MKYFFTTLALVASIASASAGGYLTNTNQHVAFLRHPARNASTSIDALYSNPAGMAFFREGWQFSINGQSAFQTRIIRTTFAPFVANADGKTLADGTREYKGTASAPFVPSLFAAYKKDRWTLGAHFALSGGGGKASFNAGLPSFEQSIALLPSILSTIAPTTQYRFDTYMEGRQYIFGVTLGAAYRISEHLSAYIGGRINYVNNHYEGYVRNIQANLGGTTMLPLSATLTALASQSTNPTAQRTLLALAAATGDKELSVDQSGWGLTPIIGINYRLGALHLAAKYEFRTALSIENKTTVNTTGIATFEDGVNTPHDLPALLSLGATYSICEPLRVSVGYHHYFDKDARMSGDRQKTLTHGTHEYLAGVEYDLSERITLSAGGQITNYGLSDGFQQDLSFSCDSFSLGLGGAIHLTPKMKLNVAYLWTNYTDYTKESSIATQRATVIPVKDLYSRTNHVFGLGLDFAL